ncbi:MAG TPA: heat-inducible transcriptional repressor HrcA [Acidiferrobacteraceae bacterium]|nr:heat-inducible transcriptional repressor HrcA [Acidiferrobacteraceae bacterium]
MALTSRAEVLLKALIKRYIDDGQPVGSRTLAKEAQLELSPASVRNVMADLEDMGLITSPHTSAGRVPTALGYRVFVDSLIKIRSLNASALQEMGNKLPVKGDPHELLTSASDLLCELTHFAGIVMLPRRQQVTLKQLEFVALGDGRILTILVTNDGQVQNRVIASDREIGPSELVAAANYFNAQFAGMSMQKVKQSLLLELKADSDEMHRLMQTAVAMAGDMLAEAGNPDDLLVRGESNLFTVPELSDIATLRNLFEAFRAKQDLLHLLDTSMKANGVQIFIGQESGYDALCDCTVVTAPYEIDGEVVGTLGVVGPTRMPYEQVIPVVDITARLLGAALRA